MIVLHAHLTVSQPLPLLSSLQSNPTAQPWPHSPAQQGKTGAVASTVPIHRLIGMPT